MTKVGIIPAYAGSTTPYIALGATLWDHPRIRGEHSLMTISTCSFWGSSPHTRGAPHDVFTGPRCVGIIPAYAGSTSIPRNSCRRAWDHPRIRGEHCKIISNSLPK